MDMKEEAIAYLRNNLEDYEIAMIMAQIDSAYMMHLAPSDCVTSKDKIIRLLDEFGKMYDFNEDWWEEFGTLDDYLLSL